ncbi:hypothetical protein HETIRDRAFT_452634 [Heterobasidion irregulare TC 32-1]|uniref:C2H2-type domain-containing protein n=1 Tax=Heterobasidion irregulare (strain TC 32-1) TaxID=747525 RepID=W4K2Z9_HETIT|nr:uncharacterized protein HETIRDRAFT_452634 [Heterobasidion irregulare TC 32-1]ETW79436.1 hypothetical protein HETIRDRAFT_452634 [Heterobasidion irregulare TC 32-1]
MGFPDVSAFHADPQSFAVDNTEQHTAAHQHEPIHYSAPGWAPVHPLPGHGMARSWYVANSGLNSPQSMLPAGGSYYQAVSMANGPIWEGAVAGVAGDDEGFEDNALNQPNFTSRTSARRDALASGLTPESVKAAGRGRTRRKAITRTPRVDKRQTPYLSSCWNCHHCESGFVRVYELRQHWRTASVHVRASLTCDECENDETFSRPDALLAHKRTFHGWP